MDLPPIKLVMLQGPREGETLEFRPGNTIRVGRVVRGNNLAIKDAGISSKHLVIEAQSGKWILRDLGSSNGTFLNSKAITAETPFDLHDGDTVKVGEYTSFTIKIDDCQEADLKVSAVKGAIEELESRRRNPPRRARSSKSQTEHSRVLMTETEMIAEEPEDADRRVNARTTRSRKNDGSLNCVGVAGKVAENPGIEVKRGRGRGRTNRGKAPVELDEKERQQVVDKERNSSENGRIDVETVQGPVGNFHSDTNTNSQEHFNGREMNFEEIDEIHLNVKQENAEVYPVEQEVGPNEKCQEVRNDGNSSGVSADLQKMTLGEWLDYMEVHYPKQIIKETEEMIEEMKRKAEKVKEYVIQQKREKAKASKG